MKSFIPGHFLLITSFFFSKQKYDYVLVDDDGMSLQFNQNWHNKRITFFTLKSSLGSLLCLGVDSNFQMLRDKGGSLRRTSWKEIFPSIRAGTALAGLESQCNRQTLALYKSTARFHF
jgi:hypothetical protein